jgi:hypothetical protein
MNDLFRLSAMCGAVAHQSAQGCEECPTVRQHEIDDWFDGVVGSIRGDLQKLSGVYTVYCSPALR